MKALRFFTIVLVAVLLISSWAPAYALPANTSSPSVVDPAKVKLAKLRVYNRSGGTLHIVFSGPRGYSFSTAKEGKFTFEPVIYPGKYVITVTSSACGGQLTFRKNVKGGLVALPGIICKHK